MTFKSLRESDDFLVEKSPPLCRFSFVNEVTYKVVAILVSETHFPALAHGFAIGFESVRAIFIRLKLCH